MAWSRPAQQSFTANETGGLAECMKRRSLPLIKQQRPREVFSIRSAAIRPLYRFGKPRLTNREIEGVGFDGSLSSCMHCRSTLYEGQSVEEAMSPEQLAEVT